MTDSGWTYEFTFPIKAAADRVFAALTSAQELERWFAERAHVEPRVGGAYRFWGRHTVGTPIEAEAGGTITAFQPGEQLAFDWAICGTPSEVSMTLAAEETEKSTATNFSIRHTLKGALSEPRPQALIEDWWRFSLGNLVAHVTGRGDVMRPDFSDTSPEIRLTMTVEAPRDVVFKALTDADALREWMRAPAPVIEPRVGGRYELGWKYEVDGVEQAGGPTKVLDIVPNERLVVNWPDWRGDASVPVQSITWLLESEGDGTRVTLVHAGFTRTVDFSDYPFGWGHFMSEMAKVAVRMAS